MIKNLLLLCVLLIFYIGAKAQTAASASWPLSSSTTTSVTTSGAVTASVETFKNTEVNGYTGANTSQRVRMAGTSNTWPANLKYQMDTVYIQFAICPKTGSILHIDSIGMGLAASSSSTFEANVYYSTDYSFKTCDTIRYASSSTNNYLSSSAIANFYKSKLSLTVSEGDTLYVRVYPWHEATSTASGKYLNIQNVIVSGYTTDVPVSSSVIWPCTSNLTTTTITGNILAVTPTLSNLLYYNILSYTSVSGASVYTGNIWNTETAPAEGRYVQFAATPKVGGTLVVDSFTMQLAAYASNSFRVSVYYSTDANFTLSTGTLLLDGVTLTSSAFSSFKASMSTTVASGDTIFFRLYPYHISTSGDKWKLVGLNNISIYGNVTGVTADLPTITTTEVSNISTTYVVTGGTISSDGGATVTARGVCWNTTGTPVISDSHTSNSTGTGTFTSIPNTLTAGTTYYLRAYATNTAGTAYGSAVSFTTLSAKAVPTVTTTAASSIMAIYAKSGGAITAWGGDSITSKGVCWNTTGTPTISDSLTNNGSGLTSFTSTLYPLMEATTYYVRAYATNGIGTGYGDVVTFTSQAVAADVYKVVASNGTGDYTTVQAAFDAVTDYYTGRWIIYVKPGTYTEKLLLNQNKVNVILYSIHPDSTILTYSDYAGKSNGSGGTLGTSGSYSTAIEADDFTAMNITFQNTIKNDGTTSSSGEQAVALRTNGDRQQFYNCKVLGYQDTYYAWGGRAIGRNYFNHCLVEGSVDFMFGRNVVLMDTSNLHVNRNGGCLTAPSTESTSSFGFVFIHDSISTDVTDFNSATITYFYLGRPWQASPRCVYLDCYEPSTLAAAGWTSMTVNPYLFAEYNCYGPGSGTSSRSTAATSASCQLTSTQAASYTVSKVFAKTTDATFGYNWKPSKPDLSNYVTSVKKAASLQFKIYPNPAVSSIIIERETATSQSAKIYSIKGTKMIETELTSSKEAINVSSLSTGIYIVDVDGQKAKLVIQ